jgi:hypothetical protein
MISPPISMPKYTGVLSENLSSRRKYIDENANMVITPNKNFNRIISFTKKRLKKIARPVYIPEHKKGLFVADKSLVRPTNNIIFIIIQIP